MKAAKLVQLAGLLITVIAAIVFFVSTLGHEGGIEGATRDMNGPLATSLAGSLVAGVFGIVMFVVGRLMVWWQQD